MNRITSNLFAYIAGTFFRPQNPPDIVLPYAKPAKLIPAKPAMIPVKYARFVAVDYQHPNSDGRRGIVPINVDNGRNVPGQNDTPKWGVLSALIERGRLLHPLARGAFVRAESHGYYAYEKRTVYHTCALAAAYAGAYGQEAIERPSIARGQCTFELSLYVGYDIERRIVPSPEGRGARPLAAEVLHLVDVDGWNRRGVAAWLRAVGL